MSTGQGPGLRDQAALERSGQDRAGPAAILIGPPGAGKSTVGSLLAELLGMEYTDTDTVVEEKVGKPVSDIFVQDGEEAFRALERAAVARCVASHRGVLGLGGGAVMDSASRELLAGQRVVYLRTGFVAAARRVGLDTPRPLLAINPRARMRELLEERLPVYEALAWLTVVTDDRDPQEIAAEIAADPAIRAAADSAAGDPADPAGRDGADPAGRDGAGPADRDGAGPAAGDAAGPAVRDAAGPQAGAVPGPAREGVSRDASGGGQRS